MEKWTLRFVSAGYSPLLILCYPKYQNHGISPPFYFRYPDKRTCAKQYKGEKTYVVQENLQIYKVSVYFSFPKNSRVERVNLGNTFLGHENHLSGGRSEGAFMSLSLLHTGI